MYLLQADKSEVVDAEKCYYQNQSYMCAPRYASSPTMFVTLVIGPVIHTYSLTLFHLLACVIMIFKCRYQNALYLKLCNILMRKLPKAKLHQFMTLPPSPDEVFK